MIQGNVAIGGQTPPEYTFRWHENSQPDNLSDDTFPIKCRWWHEEISLVRYYTIPVEMSISVEIANNRVHLMGVALCDICHMCALSCVHCVIFKWQQFDLTATGIPILVELSKTRLDKKGVSKWAEKPPWMPGGMVGGVCKLGQSLANYVVFAA